MSETKMTTQKRIYSMIHEMNGWTDPDEQRLAQTIAAEIDALRLERDEARADIASRTAAWMATIDKLKADVARLTPDAKLGSAFLRCRETRRAHKRAPHHGLLDQTLEAWYWARMTFRAEYKAAVATREP